MTWIGGVERYWPVFSAVLHGSCRSSTNVVALPAVCSSALLRQITKPRPGTPSMHLFDEAATASGPIDWASIGNAPNALIESSRKLLRYFCANAPMSRVGLRMRDGVSQSTV